MTRTAESRIAQYLKTWKTKKPQTAFREVKELFQKLGRMAAADDNGMVKCVTCGKRGKWNQGTMHWGHWYHNAYSVAMMAENGGVQCFVCNRINGGEKAKMEAYLLREHGPQILDIIRAEAAQTYKINLERLAVEKLRILDEIKIHEKRLTR